jgi:hypothetical protein
MMYMLGPIPEDDDDFLQVVETAGKRVEEYKRRQKERTSGETKPSKNNTETSRNKENDNKEDNKTEYKKEENKKEVKETKNKEKRFSST